MQETDVFDVKGRDDYEIVAFARGEKSIYYDERTGQCPGELGGWWMITKRDSSFAIYRGDAGCPDCGTDDFANWLKRSKRPIALDKAVEFVEAGDYEPIAEFPFELVRERREERTVAALFPRDLFGNFVDGGEWPDRNHAAAAFADAITAELGWPVPRQDSADENLISAMPGTEMRIENPATAPLINALYGLVIGAAGIAGLLAVVIFIDFRWWTVLFSVMLGIVGVVGLLVSKARLTDVLKDWRAPVRVQGVARKIDPDFSTGIRQFVLTEQIYSVDPSIWDWMNDGERISLLYWPRTGKVVCVNKI